MGAQTAQKAELWPLIGIEFKSHRRALCAGRSLIAKLGN
jgi:hypothetical protein